MTCDITWTACDKVHHHRITMAGDLGLTARHLRETADDLVLMDHHHVMVVDLDHRRVKATGIEIKGKPSEMEIVNRKAKNRTLLNDQALTIKTKRSIVETPNHPS